MLSTGLLKVVFSCLATALPVYRRNAKRPPPAGPENVECAAALLLLTTMLDSHLTRLMCLAPREGLTTEAMLSQKVDTYLSGDNHAQLRSHLDEVVAARDAVTHAHLWDRATEHDADSRLLSDSWSISARTHRTSRLKRTVDLASGATTSRTLAMNVVPTNVDLYDVAKALIVVCRVMAELEHEHGNPAAWIGPFPSAEDLVPLFLPDRRDDELEAWISGLLGQLHEYHVEDIVRLFDLTIHRTSGKPEFFGISCRR